MIVRRLCLVLLLAAVLPRPARAQCGAPPMPCVPTSPTVAPHDWGSEARTFGVNVALGGLTAGLLQAFRGGDFTDAFLRGALGGAVTYGGKRLAVEHFDGAGFLARQVASVGDSFVRNAAEGVPLLDRITLPLYLLRLDVHPRDAARRVQPRIDVLTSGWMLYALFQSHLSLDPAKSLSSGALVYNSSRQIALDEDGRVAFGATVGGIILLADPDDRLPAQRDATFAHERVHVLQLDQALAYWSGPLEGWALRSVGAGGAARWIDLNLPPHFLAMYSGLSYDDRPWEIEAEWLAR